MYSFVCIPTYGSYLQVGKVEMGVFAQKCTCCYYVLRNCMTLDNSINNFASQISTICAVSTTAHTNMTINQRKLNGMQS